jgi:hypothetical protein
MNKTLYKAKEYLDGRNDAIEEYEEKLKEIFYLAYTIALANTDDRLVDAIIRIAELSKEDK